MRALRTIPVIKGILEDMEEVCPAATMLNYVNPMVMLCMAINRLTPELPMVGLCHSVQGTAEELAQDLGENIKDINYFCAGINHMSFYLRFEKKTASGVEDLYPRLREIEAQGRMPDGNRVRYEMLRRLGYFVTESSEHFAEYVPWFIKRDRPDLLEQYQVPLDEYVDRCEYSLKRWGDYANTLQEESKLETYRSNEYAGEIIRAVVTGDAVVINGNVPNNGLIDNLPAEACVEAP